MYHQFIPQNLTNLRSNQSTCSYEWLLKEGTNTIPCFICGFYASITKREITNFAKGNVAIST